MRLDTNTFGSQANYSCSEGYFLNGNTTRECQADGQWSGSEPTCEGQSATYIYVQVEERGFQHLLIAFLL